MPKIVDAEARRESIADAVLAVIARSGLRAATLATIAAESGLAVGSVRHYFAGHDELLQFAVESLVDRTTVRLETHLARLGTAASTAERQRIAADMLCEVLPLDEPRAVEAAVWLEFAVASRTARELAPALDTLHDGLRALVARIITKGAESGQFRRGIDVNVEIVRLHALIDGLLLHGVLNTEPTFAETSRQALETHLEALTAEGL